MNQRVPLSADAEPLTLTGIRLELTDTARSLLTGRVRAALRRLPRIRRLHLELDEDTNRTPAARFIAKARVEMGGPALLLAAMAPAIDQAVDRLLTLVERSSRKRLPSRLAPAFSPATALPAAAR